MLNASNGFSPLSRWRSQRMKSGGLDRSKTVGGMGISALRASSAARGGVFSRTAAEAMIGKKVSLLDVPKAGGPKAIQLGTSILRTSMSGTAAKYAGVGSALGAQERFGQIDGRSRLLQRVQRTQILSRPINAGSSGRHIRLFG